ncbi:hypothetical protein AHF37_11052 [Paragonimus kellicotti]|nr:hypothetical protein AHF37_11052 [Paragonimus kellicotti]
MNAEGALSAELACLKPTDTGIKWLLETAKQHASSTQHDVHHLIHRPCSPASHLQSQEACKEKGEDQSTDHDSHVVTDKQTNFIEITGLKHQSITNGLLTHTPYSLTDSKLYARVAHLESELALVWNLIQLRNDTSCKRGDGSSLNSELHSPTDKLGQTHPVSDFSHVFLVKAFAVIFIILETRN